MKMMDRLALALMSAAMLFASVITSHGATVTLTSDLDSVVIGQPITFTLTIPFAYILPFPAPPNDGYGLVGGSASVLSGDGQTQFTSVWVGTTDITFTYLVPGSYFPSVSGTLSYHSVICDGTAGPGCQPMLNAGAFLQPFFAFALVTVVDDPPLQFAATIPEAPTWALMLLGFILLRKVRYGRQASH